MPTSMSRTNLVGRHCNQRATKAGSLETMEHLLNFKANPDDESLHIAARRTKASMVKLLLDRGASVDWPGIHTCEYRTALGEVCRCTGPVRDPVQLKDTFDALAKAQPDLTKLTNGKSVVFLALDSDSPFAMTTALLKTFRFLLDNLNADFNIYREQGRFCYSLTMYVRHFKFRSPIYPRSLDSERRCCSTDSCVAPALEKLLRGFGCRDRFWNETAGADQPPSVCGAPAHVVEAQKQAESVRKTQEKQARLRAEELKQQEAAQADLDRAAKAERRRERERLAVIREQQQADEADELRSLELLDERREADARRVRSARAEEERAEKRKNDQRAAAMERQAKITIRVLRERKRTIDSINETIQQAQLSEAGRLAAGRVLGEIGENVRFLE